MSDHYETRCPSCGGSDEQGCYADCPTTVMSTLRAENEKLRSELHTASDMNAVYESRLQDKEAENEKLRAALKLFACDCAEDDLCKFPHACRNYVARAALEEKQ